MAPVQSRENALIPEIRPLVRALSDLLSPLRAMAANLVSRATAAVGQLAPAAVTSLLKVPSAQVPVPSRSQPPQWNAAPERVDLQALMQTQAKRLESTPFKSSERALHFDVPHAPKPKLAGPSTREAAEAEFQRQADERRDDLSAIARRYGPKIPEYKPKLTQQRYSPNVPEQGEFRTPSAGEVAKQQSRSLEQWRMPKGADLSKMDLGPKPGSVNVAKSVAPQEAAAAFKAAVPAATEASAAIGPVVGGAAEAIGTFGKVLGVATAILGPFGTAAVVVAGVMVGVGLAAKKLMDVFREQAGKLEGYSGAVAVARSMSELRRELDTMYRARRIGPQVAQWERTGSRVDHAVDRVGTEILKYLVEIAEPIRLMLDGTASIVSALMEAKTKVDEIKNYIGPLANIPDLLNPLGQLGIITDAAKSVMRWLDWSDDKELAVDPFMEHFLASGRKGKIANMPKQGGNPAADAQGGVAAFSGRGRGLFRALQVAPQPIGNAPGH